jgi:hypothetical protein
MRRTLMAALLALWPSAVFAITCPIGSFPSVDQWGNQVCRPAMGGPPTVTQGTLDNCPIGSHAWVDQWGNRICKTFATPQQPSTQYYDTSRGCPIGTYQWVDNWGNKTCKRF